MSDGQSRYFLYKAESLSCLVGLIERAASGAAIEAVLWRAAALCGAASSPLASLISLRAARIYLRAAELVLCGSLPIARPLGKHSDRIGFAADIV
ncbi:MAG: hypothetical protein KatS3mg038_0996 [Candidatus Kapaibacterium sp.]|nr:MAG: hypothetical protein KatS3mg038_0996 [Candidatus Kapabacteria bacterium]